ncbi:MAG TPA: Cache 3/Cache 2 fusion domain-containing protein, partial [Anaerolineales bacterium]|nr:Cache 3/Cache 2 fusion domain-containing protein [Anaerolineales bacterium]
MNRLFFQLPENATPKMRNAIRYASIITLAAIVAVAIELLLAIRIGAWQLWAVNSVVFGVAITSFLSLRLMRKGSIERGTQVLIYGILLGLVGNPLFIEGIGIVLGITAILVTVAIALEISERPEYFIFVSFIVGTATILLDLFLPPYRLIVPELQIFAPIITGAVIVILGFMTFRSLQALRLRTRLLLLGIISVLITSLTLIAVVVWQSSQFNDLAQDQLSQSVDADMTHITEGVYNMVKAQDELVQQMVNYSLNVARQVLNTAGPVSLGEESVGWAAMNQFSEETMVVRLPKMLVGDVWLRQNTNLSIQTPVVDEVQRLVGG